MNQFFKRLSLPVKLMLIAFVPLALLLYFAFQIYNEKTEKISILDTYLNRVEQAAQISTLVDDLQTERRYSFGYIINRDYRSELVVQRPKTDTSIQKLERFEQLRDYRSYTFLDSLAEMRRSIDKGSVLPAEVMGYYTNAIFRLNTLNFVSGGSIKFLEPISKELLGQKILSEMITYLGLTRSSLYYAIYAGQNLPQSIAEIKNIHNIYQTYEREFFLKASEADIKTYRDLLQNTELKPTIEYINQVAATNKVDSSYTAESWWNVSAKAVDEVKQMQRSLVKKVQSGINNIYQNEKQGRDRAFFFLVLGIILVVVLVLYTISIISKSLNDLNRAAQRIAVGAQAGKLRVESDDVIGSLTQSIINIDLNNKKLAEAADAIGGGNFDVIVSPRSDEDILGNAVVRMKTDLQQFDTENKEKLWVLDGVEKVNESMRGEKEVSQLAKDILLALSDYLNAKVSMLYLSQQNFLRYAAGVGVADMLAIPQEIAFGETLLGQAAEKKEIMSLDDLPDEFFKIRTAGGEMKPRHIVLFPLIHNDFLEGVVELGLLEKMPMSALAFLQQVQSPIAIALQSAKSRARLQELFEETQAQAEELQAQHSELENINAELEAQTEKLQASEEELKVQQEELLQANQEMEERSRLLEEKNQVIVERNLEIQQKAEDLALSTKYKSEFLANMSHELRTPLNSILLLSRLLSENNGNNLTGEQVEYAQVIQSSGHGLLSLIDEILDLSKIESGKMELEYSQVSLKEIVNDLKGLFTPITRERNIELHVDIDPQAPSQIETDRMRLDQILKNLLSNAIKFTSKGSVSLVVKAPPENQSFITISVKDTGIGIPAEKQQLIFEAFQQADGSTRRKYGGTGLGLSISRELVKLLGGEIKVTSEPGKGSEFTVYVPKKKLKEQQKPVIEEGEERPVIEKTNPQQKEQMPVYRSAVIPQSIPDDRNAVLPDDKVILIIEDDTAFAKALSDFAHQMGYKTLVAVRGDEGIELAQKHKPVGILLDIQLPVKDGWEVMEELKSNKQTRHIPVHIMSSLEVKKESLLKGAVDFINKPVAFDQMQEVFKKLEHVFSKDHKKVLIVEENPKHAKALAYFLENFNVNVQISDSVKDGVTALQNDKVNCVILDMGIPDQQAYETLEAVKKNPGLENTPIIIFTGKSLSKNEEGRIKQYADSIVIKTAHSYQRIIDEVSLFLHLVEEGRQEQKGSKYKRLGALNEVLAGKKILVADDDVRNIFSLTKALELHQMKVYSAVDGKEALQQLEENPDMDVVLMDIMMPEMDGYEATKKIRQKAKFRNLPVIAVTAKAMSGDREKCISAGASDYISKPVDIDQLLSLLRVWLYDKNS